ncbi:MAG: AAA family ATPase [Pirellulales bacterium]
MIAAGRPASEEQQLPHDPLTETALLGSIMLKPDVLDEVRTMVGPNDFFDPGDGFDPARGILFAHLVAMHDDGLPVGDLAILVDRLNSSGDMERIGGMGFLAEVATSVPHAGNAAYYAKIIKKHAVKRRLVLVGQAVAMHAANGKAPEEILAQLAHDVDWLTGETATENKFPILTSDELASADLKITYLCEGVLVKGQPALLCGPMKTLKTTIMVALAFCLATGLKFLGKYAVPAPVRVLVMSGESGLATLREIAERVCSHYRHTLCNVGNLHWSDTLPQLSSGRDLSELKATIKRLAIDVLFVDPAYLCMDVQDSAGNLFHMGELLGKLSRVCRETGCTPILLHHAKKGGLDQGEPLELQHIAWSGFAEFARQWILLSRREKYEPGSGQHALWLSIGGSAGHGSLHGLDIEEGTGHGDRFWEVRLLDPSECRKEEEVSKQEEKELRTSAKDEAMLNRIIGLLMKTREGDTKRGLRDRLPAGEAAVGRALALGVDRGSVEPCEIVKGKQLRDGFRIPLAGSPDLTGLTGSSGSETGQTTGSEVCGSPPL